MSQTLQTGPPNPQELSLTHNVCQVVESSVPHASQYFSKLEQKNTANVLNANTTTTNTRKRKRKRVAVAKKRRKRNPPEKSQAGVETECSKIENVTSEKVEIECQKAPEEQKLELPTQIASTSQSVKIETENTTTTTTLTTTTTQRQILERKCKTQRMQNKLASLTEIKEEDTQKSTSRTKKCKKSDDVQHKKLLRNLKRNAHTVSVELFEGVPQQNTYDSENPLGQSLLPVCYPTHFKEQIVKNTEEMTLLNLETENAKVNEDIINEFDFDESLHEFFGLNYFSQVFEESNKSYAMTTLHVRFLAIFLGIDADYLIGVFERLEPMPDDALRKLLDICYQGDADLEVIPETPHKKFIRHFKLRK